MTRLHGISARTIGLAIAALVPCIAWAAGPAHKITEARARAIALAQVPGGTIETAELELERGRRIWSFDIRRPRSPNVVEVQVEANTGRLVSRKTETPADQEKEAKADLKERAAAHAVK